MLVVDLLHEFELGVWKSIFIHLLHIVNSLKGSVLAELDHQWDSLFTIADSVVELMVMPQRFRQVPTFGWDTIYHFRKNVSELKKMVACDYEDILEVSVGIFTIVSLLNMTVLRSHVHLA